MQQDGSADGAPTADSVTAFEMRLRLLRQAPNWTQLPFNRRLRRIRKARGWSHQQLAGRMILVAKSHGGTASSESLVTSLSRWENDSRTADERNRHLLADALGVGVADLGLSEDPDFVW